MVILDTNIIIDHLRLQGRQASLLEQAYQAVRPQELALSVLSIQELYEGKSTRNEAKEAALQLTLAPLTLLSYTRDIAQQAGVIARDAQKPLTFVDAAIAATAISHNAQLFTRNTDDFTGIPGLTLYQLPPTES